MHDSRPNWVARMVTLEQEVHAWSQAHPKATLTAIEGELDRRLQAARAELLGEVVARVSADERCAQCGGPLLGRGQRERTLTTQGGKTLSLNRRYLHCPACESGLPPPWMRRWGSWLARP